VDIDAESREARLQLHESLKQLLSIDVEDLARTEDLGKTMDFSAGVPVFSQTRELFKRLADANLDSVPATILRQLTGAVGSARKAFEQISSFNPSGQPNPSQQRDKLLKHATSQYEEHFRLVAPLVAYSANTGSDLEHLERQAREALQRIEDGEKSVRKLATTASEAVAEVRTAAAQVGVARHAVHFTEEAKRHAKARQKWLLATVASALAVLGYGGFNVYYYTTHTLDIPASQSVQLALAKLVVFGALYFGVIWSGRMYRSESHNWVVNQHRQNSLSTFETFVKASSDDQTRNAVLLQATQSIFAHQVSGFSQQDSEGTASPQVLEIVRNMTGRPE
jgi:hypothetical protein